MAPDEWLGSCCEFWCPIWTIQNDGDVSINFQTGETAFPYQLDAERFGGFDRQPLSEPW